MYINSQLNKYYLATSELIIDRCTQVVDWSPVNSPNDLSDQRVPLTLPLHCAADRW